MIYVLILLICFLAILLQGALLPGSIIYYFHPDYVLILVSFCGLHLQRGKGLILAFLLGFIADVHSGSPYGLNILFMILIFLTLNRVQSKIFIKGILIPTFFVAILSLLKGPSFFIIMKLLYNSFDLNKGLVFHWLQESISTTLISPLIFIIIYRIHDTV